MSKQAEFDALKTKESKKAFLEASASDGKGRTNAQLLYKDVYDQAKKEVGGLQPGETHTEYFEKFNPLKRVSERFRFIY